MSGKTNEEWIKIYKESDRVIERLQTDDIDEKIDRSFFVYVLEQLKDISLGAIHVNGELNKVEKEL